MSRTQSKSKDIGDGEVKRDDLNTDEIGQAVIRKIIAGDGLEIESSTGADPGTGDVTIRRTELQGFTIFPIWAEESGALSDNNRQWSFGNGAVGNINIPIPFDCEIFAMSFQAEIAGTSVSIELMRDNLPATSQLFNGASDTSTITTPVQFTAGQQLGFRTDVETGAYTDARVCAWARVKSSILSTSIMNDLLDVSIGSIAINQILQWNGTSFVPFTLPDTLDRVLVSTPTNTTTNINNAALSNIPVFGSNTLINDNASFAVLNESQIRVDFDGWVELNANIPYISNGTRVSLNCSFAVNGNAIGPRGKTGYIRNTGGHNESSLHISGCYIQVTSGQIISLQTVRESTTTTSSTMISGQGQISIKRVKT